MPIIYYDGNCVYCYNYAIWLIQNGLSHKYEFATIKGQIGKQFFENYPDAQNKNSVDSCSRCRQGFFCSDHGMLFLI